MEKLNVPNVFLRIGDKGIVNDGVEWYAFTEHYDVEAVTCRHFEREIISKNSNSKRKLISTWLSMLKKLEKLSRLHNFEMNRKWDESDVIVDGNMMLLFNMDHASFKIDKTQYHRDGIPLINFSFGADIRHFAQIHPELFPIEMHHAIDSNEIVDHLQSEKEALAGANDDDDDESDDDEDEEEQEEEAKEEDEEEDEEEDK